MRDRLRLLTFSIRVNDTKESLAKVSFSPGFSLGLQYGPILRNRFNGLRVSSQPSSLPSFTGVGFIRTPGKTVETVT